MTTMDSDSGTSSSAELDDEPLQQLANESDTIYSFNIHDVSDDVGSDARESPRSSSPEQETPTAVTMTARAYQVEMLEESLKQNIIVAVC